MEGKGLRVAVATEGNKGFEDKVSHGFGHSKTFTILDIEDGEIKKVEVIQNPAESASHGRGPILAKHLATINVKMVITSEVGPGALAMLNMYEIKVVKANPGELVSKALKDNALIK
jgi:predicted Fe-Mo cluster-binding NifX family protein